MVDIKISDEGSIERTRRSLEKKQDLYRRGLKLQMWRVLTILEAAIIARIRRQFNVRTGLLMNSISNSKRIEESGDTVTGVIGSSAPYSAIHEFGSGGLPGGVVTPKRSKFLKFPMEENRRDDGLAINPEVNHPTFIPLKKGGFALMETQEDGFLLPRFILKESVKIPPRPYFGPAIERNRDRIKEQFAMVIKAVFKSAEGGA